MPLHPLAQAFLEECIAAGAQPVCSMSVEEARRVSAAMFASVPPGDPVARVEDTYIAGSGHDIPVRVYTPEGEGPFPGHTRRAAMTSEEPTVTPRRAAARSAGPAARSTRPRRTRPKPTR